MYSVFRLIPPTLYTAEKASTLRSTITRIWKLADHTPYFFIISVHSLILELAWSTLGFFSVAFIKTLKSRLTAENRFVSWGMAMRRSRLENTYKNNNKSVSSPNVSCNMPLLKKSAIEYGVRIFTGVRPVLPIIHFRVIDLSVKILT